MTDEIPNLPKVSEEELKARSMDGLNKKLSISVDIEPAIKEEAVRLAKEGVPKESIFQRVFGMLKRLFGGLAEKIVDEAIDEAEEAVEGVVDRVVDRVDDFVDDGFDDIRRKTRDD